MASPKNDVPEAHRPTRRRTVVGIIVGVVVLAVVAVVVVVSISHGSGSNGSASAAASATGAAIAPSSGAGAVLPPSTGGPAAATGSPVASDPAQPDVLPAVPLTATATPAPGLTVSISGLAAVNGVANGVGEVSGPALAFTVTAVNTGTASVSLASTVVGVTYGSALTPADELTSASTSLPVDVAAGATVSGSYVFTIPADQRDQVQISVDYQAGVPVVVFAGTTP
ncbi:hypothetical protein [Subtercola lobariae]|uniref:DUF4352 domain-containing protein n=1 Tax=Subtercola lobariae TaxID=1588641 RepID=A0A917EUH1_9MICO|nr:hypothetical protein [Subtercola lobariae]GGF13808.1 hypothetical protein GCM10011399_04600 [Subtercola lobariae]